MPIDLAQVDWLYVGVLTIMAFLASLIGSLLSFHQRMKGALLSALLFAVMFLGWTYYPHGLPLPTGLTIQKSSAVAPAPAVQATPAAPARPANPVTDITPPKNPVTDITPPRNPVTEVTPPAR
jgi:hypothetical protein